jgi:hypothetical protein
MQEGLTDSRWPILADAVRGWSQACLKALKMARMSETLEHIPERVECDLPVISPLPSNDLAESALTPVHSLHPPKDSEL